MLNRPQLIHELEDIADQLFAIDDSGYQRIGHLWTQLCADPLLSFKVRKASSPWLVPTWSDDIAQTYAVSPLTTYAVVAVDGSQIYPDRHYAVGCYVINTGLAQFSYGIPNVKSVALSSQPTVCVINAQESSDGAELVNCQREEFELKGGLEAGSVMKSSLGDYPMTVLCDGSLIFWHLQSKDELLRERFLSSYIALLHGYYAQRIPIASYISFPRSKELINLVRLSLCNFQPATYVADPYIDRVVDAMLVRSYVEPGYRTVMFRNQSPITEHYPDHLKPHFFYINVGQEVGRVELPAWVAQDSVLVEHIASIILDQCAKGRGYPVSLAEAHEQAVIKGPDRDFFFHVVQKVGVERHARIAMSQKSLKKRSIGI